jgi:hypothetical protein
MIIDNYAKTVILDDGLPSVEPAQIIINEY